MGVYSRFPMIQTKFGLSKNSLERHAQCVIPWNRSARRRQLETVLFRYDLEAARLSSKSHWDVPINVNGRVLHVLASHPTPPVFDGPEDRNGDVTMMRSDSSVTISRRAILHDG